MKKFLLFLLVCAFSVCGLSAKVILPPIFADNMVLQQQSDVALWGKAAPDVKVTVSASWAKSAKVTVRADDDGRWFARIATPAAGGPYELTFSDGEKITLRNVLVGEVWICSGQSNMYQKMRGFEGQPVEDAAEYISEADPSVPVRMCNMRLTRSMTPQRECGATWYVNDQTGVAMSSAVAYFFALKLHKSLKVPVAVINASWSGSKIEQWMNREVIDREFSGEFEVGELVEGKPGPASCVYNGVLYSLIPYTVKGFLWYQGESNIARFEQYKRLQPAFVKMLRDEWGNDRMPFYFAQIAPYRYAGEDHRSAGYMMWAQAQTLKEIPFSGMAATHDVGSRYCAHPPKKKQVGDRFAYLALANDYGFKEIEAKTPMPKEFVFDGEKAIVCFDVSKLGVGPINSDLSGFELAGEDKVFYPAVARVDKDCKSVTVTSPQVAKPIAVRYAMRNWSEATLFNSFGIPVSPFRSDDWR